MAWTKRLGRMKMTAKHMHITKGTKRNKPFCELPAVGRHFKRSAKVSFPDLQLKFVIKVSTLLVVLTYARSRQIS